MEERKEDNGNSRRQQGQQNTNVHCETCIRPKNTSQSPYSTLYLFVEPPIQRNVFRGICIEYEQGVGDETGIVPETQS